MEQTTKISYRCPPVAETVVGIQFDRLPKCRNGHLGAFWKSLNADEWPIIADAPPIPDQVERFTESERWAAKFSLQLTDDPASRLQITNKMKDRMIQVQSTRLHLNWLKKDTPYPRFEVIHSNFDEIFAQFSTFVHDHELGEMKPNQWEVTYVNKIKRGTVWDTPNEWGFFKPLGSFADAGNAVHLESFGGEWHFLIPEKRGRLHVLWQHSLEDDEDFVRITLTARGAIAEKSPANIKAGLELGRDTVVRSFRDLMTDKANDIWELQR